ncbi:MAG: glycoside hydrolase family 31 protein [Ruminococcaceae bacterium]|nr:glycoside hydrolase family 31 protein [Oscillospiraceae bacterium]
MIHDLLKKEKAVYFKNTEGLQFELTYHGGGMWRLRADGKNGASFENAGDAQRLAAYLGEKIKDTTIPFDGRAHEKAFVWTGEDGYTASLSLAGDFSISFYGKDGARLSEMTSVLLDDGKMHLVGTLNEGDAVFGGGQRFDTCNRRGTSLRLFSYDAYNTDHGRATYMPIPLFYTTSGGGMFFNHYERMCITFGDLKDNTWSLELCKDELDVYFYTEGSYASVLKSYTELTGYAVSVPTEWMQGVLICRYNPDFTSLEPQQYVFDSFDEIPEIQKTFMDSGKTVPAHAASADNGEKPIYYFDGKSGLRRYVYHQGKYYRTSKKGHPQGAGIQPIVERLIAAGQKPTAMVLEGGFGFWKDCTQDTEKAKRGRQLVKDTVKWLHERNIKVMTYNSISNISPTMEGYKPEYQLWVDLTDSKGNVTSTFSIPQQKFTDNPDVGLSGRTYMDITNPEAVNWYIDTVWQDLIDLGLDGIKIDFCEMLPEEGTYNVYNENKEVIDTKNLKYRFHDPDMFTGMNVHHALPTYFISIFCKKMNEKIAKRRDGKGFMVLSRGGAFGSQRNPYLWAGDQTRVFENLQTQLTAIVTAGLSGVPFMTYDMAGYSYTHIGEYFEDGVRETESEIYARAIEYTAFTSCIQTHGDVRHLYEMTEETQRIAHLYTALHNELLPYIQKLTRDACATGMAVVRHLVLNYPKDERVYGINDEFMLGNALLVAPILSRQTFEREVYLPAGNWTELLTGEKLTGGRYLTVKASMAQLPLFLNNDSEDAAELAMIFANKTWSEILAL